MRKKFPKKISAWLVICLMLLSKQGWSAEQVWTQVEIEKKPEDKNAVLQAAAVTEDDPRLQQLISLDYKDADLSSVLRSFAYTYKLNIVTSPDIKGKVSINLQDISVEKALSAILTINGLVYSKRDGVIYISAGDTDVVEIKTEVLNLKYLAPSQAQNLAKKILSTKGDIKINESANNIIVTDYTANIENIKKLLEQVDTAPKQVIIEAKIVDIGSSDLRSIGVTWNADYKPTNGGLFGRDTRSAEELKGGMTLPGQSDTLSGGQLAINTLTLKNMNLTATIDALVRDGKANLLASPSIAVLNGQEAKIVIGERFPFKERTQTPSGTTETTKFVDIGTSLKVNPQINDDGYITLSLHPEVSSLLASLDAGPRITTREADTTVRIKEGETLVIGGLILQKDNKNRDRIPILGDLPLVGALFSRNSTDKEQSELAVFITPRILFSKEEMAALGKKKDEWNNSYLLIDQTAPLTVVERIFEKAQAMDHGEGLESVRKDEPFRKTQALSHYELIYKEFPESRRAPEAKYLAGMLRYEYFKDLKNAKEVFSSLISDYPASPYAEKARRMYKEIEEREKKEGKRRQKNK